MNNTRQFFYLRVHIRGINSDVPTVLLFRNITITNGDDDDQWNGTLGESKWCKKTTLSIQKRTFVFEQLDSETDYLTNAFNHQID